MPAKVVALGPGTVTIGSSPLDFSCEVVGASITHEYEETSEQRTRLCGDVVAASESRTDGFTASLENDLEAAGLYAYIQSNDLTDQPFEFVPNTTVGATTQAKWAGTVRVKLPSSIGADAFGEPIASEIEWTAIGKLNFTPAAA
jgi:hypothetical protein